MKVTCSRAELVEALSNVSRAASPKSALKVIEGVLFKVSRHDIFLCCYNLDMGISKRLEATVEEPGDVVLPLKLVEYARRMTGSQITITCNERYSVHLASDQTAYDIIGMPPIDFPELPEVQTEHTLRLPESLLRSMVNQTAHAISNRTDMPVQYTGILFEINPDNIRLVSLDGYRVAIRNECVESGIECSFVVPGKTIAEITRLLSDTDDITEMYIAKHNMVFNINGYSLISRLMSGTFMNYKSALVDAGSKCVDVKTSDIIMAVERMSVIISEADKSPVVCRFGKSNVSFLCSTDSARADDSMGCKCNFSDPIVIGFNNRYMLDAFKAADTEYVKIYMSDSRSPIQIVPPEGDKFLFLLMPVLLKPEIENSFREVGRAYRDTDELDAPEESEADFSYDYNGDD